MQLVAVIKAKELRPRMVVSKSMNPKPHDLETIQEYTGKCHAGVHFGNGCYAWIGTWYVFEKGHGK